MPQTPVLLTCDSVDPQTLQRWREQMAQTATYVFHGPKNGTHVWHCVDRHVGKMVKGLFRDLQEGYANEDDGMQNFKLLAARDRRILATHLVGQAWERYIGEKHQQHRRCADCNGRVGDELITVESCAAFRIQDYASSPPAPQAAAAQVRRKKRVQCQSWR